MLRLFVTATAVLLIVAACSMGDATEPATTQVPHLTTTSRPPPAPPAPELPEPERVSTLTGIGRMTWELYPLDYLVTHVDSYKGGYVALLYDGLSHRPEYRGIAEPGVVATSLDGVIWTPLPDQPGDPGNFTAQVLAIEDNGDLIVLGRPLNDINVPQTSELLAYTWNGGSWEELPVSVPFGSTTRGGELDAAYLDDGSVMFVGGWAIEDDGQVIVPGAWYVSEGELIYGPANTDGWPNFLARFDTVHAWPNGSGMEMPSSTVAFITEHDGRFVAIALPGHRGQAWTSADGQKWESIQINAPWNPSNGDQSVVTPEVVDAGELGWIAVGSWTATGAVWVSRDGVTWGHVEELPGPAAWDPRVPWPPATVVDDQRMLIYARAYNAVSPVSQSMVWVGTVDA